MFTKIIGWAQGRHTLFCVAFFTSGNILHCYHRLDSTYITFMVTLMGFVLGHSVKEDYFASKNPDSGNKE